MSSIRLANVTKRYPGASDPAVRSVSETIENGEFFVLVGPSGCGKSTLLKLLAGLEHPTEGEIYIADRLVNYVEPRERNVALVFQNYALYPHMSAEQNIRFPLKMDRIRGPAAAKAVEEASRPLGLGPLLHRPVSQLSGGERQRVALARAIVRRPTVTLMDEPLSNLDALLRVQTREELLRLHRNVPGTVVYVTHDQVEAMSMGDRIGVMDAGRLVQVGTPVDLYEHPLTQFVAGFLGSPPMNFVKGELTELNGDTAFRSEDLRIDLATPVRDILHRRRVTTGPVTLGVRPEAVQLHLDGAAPSPWRVELLEYHGTEYIVTTRHGDTRLRVRTAPSECPAGDAPVRLEIDPRRIYLFDGRGENLTLGFRHDGGSRDAPVTQVETPER